MYGYSASFGATIGLIGPPPLLSTASITVNPLFTTVQHICNKSGSVFLFPPVYSRSRKSWSRDKFAVLKTSLTLTRERPDLTLLTNRQPALQARTGTLTTLSCLTRTNSTRHRQPRKYCDHNPRRLFPFFIVFIHFVFAAFTTASSTTSSSRHDMIRRG